MAAANRSIFKSRLFWLTIVTLILSILFVFWGQHLGVEAFKDSLKRLLYGSVFFLGVVIAELLYLFLTKEEERESRIARREARKEERKLQKAQLKLKKSAVKALEKKFYEALSIIKKSNIYKKRANYNYELPWYLLLGGEDDEQKAILKNSGLDFPINIEYKEHEEDKAGLFKWFFAEEGVFVTVPKDYVTLDKNSASHPIWLAFLKLFKKERWRRPINGIIFTVNASEIIHNSEVDTNEFAKVVREKLDEISKAFSSQIPVYVIITGVQGISAFDSFFSNLTVEEKREVLGITFEDNVEDISLELIESKISKLVQNLEHETLGNMQHSWDKEERKKIFFFLEEFQGFLSKVSVFAQKTFSKTRYYAPLMLRGIYFSDITHGTSSKYALTAQGSPIKSGLFMPKVFERIILSETQLVKVNDDYRKKFGMFWLILFAFLTLAIAGIIYFWTSFIQGEAKEVKIIEDTYEQYLSLKKGDKPKITLKRKASKPKNAMQIGKLGGADGGDVSFGKGNASLTPFAKKELKKIIEHIKTLDESTKIKIVGHTDSIGDEESNMELSKDRAISVKKFFVDEGIDSDRITIEGAGESSPIANNQTVEGRSLNRRVEIYAYGLQIEEQDQSYKEEYIIKDHLTDMQRILAMLDALKSMQRDADDEIDKEVWKPGFSKIALRDKRVKTIYHESLETLLLPRVATLIEKQLLRNLSNKLETQTNLKAYLMLADSTHRQKDFLENYMLNKWGEDLEDTEVRRLNDHFSTLLSTQFSPAKLRHKSIFRARKKLVSHAGAAGLIYKNLQKEAEQKGLNDFQFLEVLDAYPNAFTGAEYRIPGLYTKEGYEKIILLQTKFIIKKSMLKSWILGDEGEDYGKNEINRIYEKVLGLYFIDYRRYWTKALAQLNIPSYHSSAELSDQLELLSSGVSPTILVLRAFKENTFLHTPKEKAEKLMEEKTKAGVTAGEFLGTVGSKIDRFQRLGTKTMKDFAGDKMVYDMRSIFKPYHELLDEHNGVSRKFKIVLRHVEKIYQQMLEVDTSADPKQSAFQIVSKKSTSSHKTFKLKSNLLPTKLLGWYNKALTNSWDYLTSLVDGHLDKTYNDEIWTFYVDKIEDKFPLNLQSDSDIALDDFRAFFQKDGLLDKFYAKYVEPFVTINASTGAYKLKKIDGAMVAIDKQMIQSMLSAKKIQKLLFQSGSGKLYFKISAKPKRLSNNLAAMDLVYEDQELLYEHGPIQSSDFTWPAQYPDSLAKFTFYDAKSNRVVKIRGEGEWALLRLLVKLKKKMINNSKMIISYKKGAYSGSFEVKGKVVSLFSKSSPLKHFKLKKK
jgi:type VI protein secretion system component VasK